MAAPLRELCPSDIPALMRLKEAAGWNQTERDWRNVMALAPDGCFGIECGGSVAASATAVCYGNDLAWIGMVLTHPDYRGRGFARALMEHALEYLCRRGVRWIKLDATDMGRPLYEKLGFVEECAIERWRVEEARAGRPARPTSDWQSHPRDREAFGADRGVLLKLLAPMGALSTEDGYALFRPGSKAAYFGPCVTASAETARELLASFLSRHAGQAAFWDILPHNASAAALAGEFGFSPVRRLVRMARPGVASPGALPHNDSLVYAIAGFEYG